MIGRSVVRRVCRRGSQGNGLCMASGFLFVLAYIDPTGGLPPSTWWIVIAALAGCLGAAVAFARGFGRRILLVLKRSWRVLVVVLAFAAGALMVWAVTRRGEAQGQGIEESPRVVILAMDGLDPGLLRQYMDEGRLPNFSRLAKSGVFHELRTTIPPQSPVAWASFITGRSPEGHGVFDFLKRNPKTYMPDLATADRTKMGIPWKGKPFWEDESIQGVSVTILRLPLTFPPLKLNGRLLSGMGVWDARGTEGTYFFYSMKPLMQDARGLAFSFEQKDGVLCGYIPGPYRVGGKDNIREPFELQVKGDEAEMRLQGETYVLREGRWSDWIALEFRLGALQLQRVAVVTRVLWQGRGDDATLYVSPLNFDPARPLLRISYPADYSRELCEAIGCYHTRGMPYDTQAVNDGVLSDDAFLEDWDCVLIEREKMLSYELARFEKGLLIVYFEASDAAQHVFWRAIDPENPQYAEALTARYRAVIPKCYERFDSILGRTVSALGRRGVVVVISDHGFAPFRRAVHLNAVLRDLGYLALRDDAASSAEFFRDVDWSRTRAYAVGFNALYLNLSGREGNGIVSADGADEVAKEIASALEGFRDPETGGAPVKKAYLASEVYRGAESREHMPDIVVGYRRGYRASWETALGGVPERTVEANTREWSGDHCMDADAVPGIFLSSDADLDAKSIVDVGRAVIEYFRGTEVASSSGGE